MINNGDNYNIKEVEYKNCSDDFDIPYILNHLVINHVDISTHFPCTSLS